MTDWIDRMAVELKEVKSQLAAMTAERDEALKQHPQLLATIRCMEIAQGAIEAERDALVGAVIEQAADFIIGHATYLRSRINPMSEVSDPPLTKDASGNVSDENKTLLDEASRFEAAAFAISALATSDHHAALEAVKAKARADERARCLQAIADLPTGKSEDEMSGQEQVYRAIEALAAAEKEAQG